ncbi:MAG: SufD family Fe-S cluster assembly protein [Candidatus Altiarchaeota archaeon]|nr:SufD family Fe-S cluster assembly protein [Candidatus Altiarchaeota archaeon]
MDIKKALEKYEWLSNLYWKLVGREKDEYTKKADEKVMGGYFIRILPGKRIPVPLQTCMFISKQDFTQYVHNIIIAEEGSEAQIISGCATTEDVRASEHVGISEFYVKKDAKLTFTMIHNWNMEMKIRPRSSAIVEDNATFSSNYVILKPVKDLRMYPETTLAGKNSVARFSNLMYAEKDSRMDVGSKVMLIGDKSKAEIISRAIAKDDSRIIARGMLEGANPTVKAHLECRGLLLGKKARIHAIPELIATGEGAEMSHEAAVGKIAEKEILYLMSRKLSRDDATSLIIRGFLDTRILHLPPALEETIKNMTSKVAEGL